MSDFILNIPITKIDEEKRLVYGIVTKEELDSDGEMLDYASSKPNFQAWNEKFKSRTGGKSVGNLRSMHSNISAGIFTDMQYNDALKEIEACAKVLDDNEWNKTKEGGYTGFSIGGKYAKRWVDKSGITRYTGVPSEISLVDSPAVGAATFTMIKSDGTKELKEFNSGVKMEKEIKKDIGGAMEVLQVAQAAETIALGETINGENTADIAQAVDSLKAQAQSELKEPEMHEDIAAALQDEGADEQAEDLLGGDDDEDEDEDEMAYAEKPEMTKAGSTVSSKEAAPVSSKPEGAGQDTAKANPGVIQPGFTLCDKCMGTGSMTSGKCSSCAGKGVIGKDADKMEKIAAAEKKFGIGDSNKFDMPTVDEVSKLLEAKGIEVNQNTIGMVMDKAAGSIMENVKKSIQLQTDADFNKIEFLKKLNEEIKSMKKDAPSAADQMPFAPGQYINVTEVPAETPEVVETPVVEEKAEDAPKAEEVAEDAPKAPEDPETEVVEPAVEAETPVEAVTPEDSTKMVKSESGLSKLDGLMEKLDTLSAKVASFEKLEERIEKVENSVMPIKVQTHLIEKFEKSETTSENLLEKIDAVAERLKVEPNNAALKVEATALTKEWFASRR